MKKKLLLAAISLLTVGASLFSQNVFNPNDLYRRWKDSTGYRNDSTSLTSNPNPNTAGLYKWVTVKTNGVDSSWGKDYKAYFLNVAGAKLAFRLKYPYSFTNPDSAGKMYPSMLFFHGAGEPGCPSNGGLYNNEKQLVHGGKTFRDRVVNKQYDGFLIYPQLFDNNCWSDWGSAPFSVNYKVVFAFLDSLIKYARADIDRVQVFGLSNGGGAAWSVTTAFPQRIAKSTPSSAATGAANFADFIHIPIWFATGGKDTNPRPSYALSTFNRIAGAGGDIRYTRFDSLGHFAWNAHWGYPTSDPVTDYPLNGGPFPSFVQYMNDVHKANPLVYFQHYAYCPDSAINARIGVTPGFYAYEWQKDGVTVATWVNGAATFTNSSVVSSFTGNEITAAQLGTYRVRFQRTSTSAFCIWSPKPAVLVPKAQTVSPPIQINGLRSKVLPAVDGSATVPLILPVGYFGYQWVRVSDNAIVSTSNTYGAAVGQYKAKIIEQFGCGSTFSAIFTAVNANGTPKPDAATALLATANGNTIQLSWTQTLTPVENETGFEVWRATKAGGPYQLIAITAADVTSYTDQNPVLNLRNYYVVRAVGNSGAAAKSNEASAGNNKPTIAGLSSLIVKTNATTQDDFSVTDDPGDVITVALTDAPGFVTLTNLGSGNYRVTATPTGRDQGVSSGTVVATDDKGAQSTQTITVLVGDENTRSVYINLGDPTKPAPKPWNNFLNAGQAGQTTGSLVDEANVATGFSMQLTDAWTNFFNTGHITGNNSGVAFDSVLTSGIYYNGTTDRHIQISGLNNLKLYNVVFIGSQNEGYDASALYTLAGGTQADTLNARYNTNQTGNLNGIIPVGGTITINLTKLLSASFMFLNGVIIEEYDGTTPMLNPTNLFIEPRDRTTTALSWSDRTNGETGMQVERAIDSLFTQQVRQFDLPANTTTFVNAGLVANSKYWYHVRARNGAVFSGWSNVVKTITPQNLTFVNFNYAVANGPAPWNNLQALPNQGFVFTNLKNQSGNSTGYNLTITKSFNGENNAGMTTGNDSGMDGLVPDNVMKSSFWMDKLQQSQVKLSNLNAAKRYRIGFISSSNWVGGNLTTTLTVNGRTVYINPWKNTTKIVYIGNLLADQNRELFLDFSTTAAAANGYCTGFILEEYDDVNGGTVLNSVTGNRETLREVTASHTRVLVYPNPFTSSVNVEFENTSSANKITVQVYDVHGRVVLTSEYTNLGVGHNTIPVPGTAKLETGIYMLVLKSNGKTLETTKVIRTR